MESKKSSIPNLDCVILLTACRYPDSMAYAKLQNPEVRKLQYVDAVNFYLSTKQLGKGYVEMRIVEYANENSNFIKQANSICKVTGRYKILSINRILNHFVNSNCVLMVDLLHQMRYSDSRIFIANNFFWRNTY